MFSLLNYEHMVELEGFGTLISVYEIRDFSAVVYVHLVDNPMKRLRRGLNPWSPA